MHWRVPQVKTFLDSHTESRTTMNKAKDGKEGEENGKAKDVRKNMISGLTQSQ
jgi:hypothetical protein